MKTNQPKALYSDWLYIPKGILHEGILKAALTFTIGRRGKIVKTIEAYRDTGDYIAVPREFYTPEKLLESAGITIEDRTPTSYDQVILPDNISFRDDVQEEAYKAMEKSRNGILNLNCGRGKTVLVLKEIANSGVPAVVIVHTSVLFEQWKREIRRFLGVDPGMIQGPMAKWSWRNPVVIAMLHTLAENADEIPAEIRNYFGITCFDECLGLDTKIEISSGRKLLGDIKVGDRIVSPKGKNITVTKTWRTIKGAVRVYTKSGGKIIASLDHIMGTTEGIGKKRKALTLPLRECKHLLYISSDLQRHENDPIVAMESVGEIELMDISVDSDDELFIANNFIVHNCHHISAEWFSKAAPIFYGRRIGNSATAFRSDGLDPIFINHIGPIFFKHHERLMEPRVLFVDAPVTRSWDNIVPFILDSSDTPSITKLWGALGEDEAYIGCAMSILSSCMMEDRKVLVLSRRLITLHTLKLRMDETYPGMAGIVSGEESNADRLRVLRDKKVILGITQLAVEGLDEPTLDTLIMMEPCKAHGDEKESAILQQSIGRILRENPGKKDPKAYLMRAPYPPCYALVLSMKQHLRKKGMKFEEVNLEECRNKWL